MTNVKVPATQDRRKHKRYKTVRYTAFLQRRNALGRFGRAREAAVVDFNRTGMALCSDKGFRAGDRIRLQLYSSSERISGIHAVVRHIHKDKNEYCLGIEFAEDDLHEKLESPGAQHLLENVEQVVKHQLA